MQRRCRQRLSLLRERNSVESIPPRHPHRRRPCADNAVGPTAIPTLGKRGPKEVSLVPLDRIERRILLLRGQKVMLDRDLAELYGVPTGAINQAVKRNCSRFPEDFMFKLTLAESEALRSQTVISKRGRGGRRYRPLAFTEQGVAMLSSVLRSELAVQVNIAIMRTFVRLREFLASHADLARKLGELEAKHSSLAKVVFDLIAELTAPLEPQRKGRIGFGAAGHAALLPRGAARRSEGRGGAGTAHGQVAEASRSQSVTLKSRRAAGRRP
jgi:ORF6N domain-containing protein